MSDGPRFHTRARRPHARSAAAPLCSRALVVWLCASPAVRPSLCVRVCLYPRRCQLTAVAWRAAVAAVSSLRCPRRRSSPTAATVQCRQSAPRDAPTPSISPGQPPQPQPHTALVPRPAARCCLPLSLFRLSLRLRLPSASALPSALLLPSPFPPPGADEYTSVLKLLEEFPRGNSDAD